MKDSKPKKKSGYAKSIVISVLLHALLVVALVWGTDFTMSKPEPSGKMVEAVVIDLVWSVSKLNKYEAKEKPLQKKSNNA